MRGINERGLFRVLQRERERVRCIYVCVYVYVCMLYLRVFTMMMMMMMMMTMTMMTRKGGEGRNTVACFLSLRPAQTNYLPIYINNQTCHVSGGVCGEAEKGQRGSFRLLSRALENSKQTTNT